MKLWNRLQSSDDLATGTRWSMRSVMPLQIVFVLIAIGFGFAGIWGRAGLALLLVPTLWLPAALEILTKVKIPRLLQTAYMLFITAAPLAGSALNVYSALPGWDKVVHFYSGALVGWTALFALEKLGILARHRFAVTAFIVQCTVMASAAAWEICEFTSDHLLGTQAQRNNLDTMTDIIAGTLGGIVMLLIARFAHRPKAIVTTLIPQSRPQEAQHSQPTASVNSEAGGDD